MDAASTISRLSEYSISELLEIRKNLNDAQTQRGLL
jgi:hypothetical protein